MTKAEKTRQHIIEKTAPLFNTKGFAGTSLNDMADATGLTKGSIYGNFSNKDEVALAVFDYHFSRVCNEVVKRMETHSTAVGKLHVYIEMYRQFPNRHMPGGCPILNTAIESDDTHPDLKARAATAIRTWSRNVERIIAAGIRDGEIDPATDGRGFAAVFIALIEGGIMMSKVGDRSYPLHACLRHAEQLIEEIKL